MYIKSENSTTVCSLNAMGAPNLLIATNLPKVFGCTISKTRASVSSGYPNTEKQMKAQGHRPSAFIVSRCLDTPIKHEARVLEITSHDHS